MVRDPETRRRVSRVNGPDAIAIAELPELAIIARDVWDAVQERIAQRAVLPLVARRRPRSLLSGLVRCGECRGAYSNLGGKRWGCTRHREAGTCPNGVRIDGDELQARVLAGLQDRLLSPDAVSLLVKEFHAQRSDTLRRQARNRRSAESRMATSTAAIERLVSAIADGAGDFAEVREALAAKRAERDSARAELAELQAGDVIALHPQIAAAYRARIEQLVSSANTGDLSLLGSAGQIRELIDVILVTPRASGGCDLEVLGSLEAVIALAEPASPQRRRPSSSAMAVAEEGFEPPTPGL